MGYVIIKKNIEVNKMIRNFWSDDHTFIDGRKARHIDKSMIIRVTNSTKEVDADYLILDIKERPLTDRSFRRVKNIDKNQYILRRI